MYLKDFNYLRPKSLTEACEMLQKSRDGALIAGGTDLLVEMKMGLRHHEDIISLVDINELKQIEDAGDYIIIGAGVTHSSIANSVLLKQNYSALSEASSNVGTEQVRNAATVGGNICTGASCCDTGPVLLASDCILELTDINGSREISVKDFFVFHRKTAIKKGEILTRIKVPKLKAGTGISIEKFGLRSAASISVASAVALITINNGVCAGAKIVIGAVAPTPFISESASKILIGAKIHELIHDSELLNKAGDAAVADSDPLSDIRGSANYRKQLVKVLVKRTIKNAANRATN
nr:xanthine dehydrogenase family protein subunit M [Bacteroidota bacterium]